MTLPSLSASARRSSWRSPHSPRVETGLRSLRPSRRRRPTGGDRGDCPGAEKLGSPERDLRERLVVDAVAIGEQLDEPRELLVVVELVDVEPGVGLRELLPERDHLPDGGLLLLPPSHVEVILLLH